jgi:amidase
MSGRNDLPSGELWSWNAVDLRRGIAERHISSREALESCLARTRQINPTVNAIVDLMVEEAYASADLADAAVRASSTLGYLHGVPVTVKVNVDYGGRATTNGVVAFKDRITAEDSVPVSNLKKAGAVIFGRTNVPCLSTRYFTDNDLHGRTLNPWNRGRTPGGSSGGAAAAAATGMGPIAHGNDRAGSVRYPAYACGVVGLRPSLGRVPDYNPSAPVDRGLGTQVTHLQGPLARTVGDTRLALHALAARDARDPWWVPAPFEPRRPIEPIKVAMFAWQDNTSIDPAVTAAVRQAGKWLEASGYAVEEIAPPGFLEAAQAFWKLLMTEERVNAGDAATPSKSPIALYGDASVKRARGSTVVYAGQYDFNGYINALARRATLMRQWQLFFEHYPLLLLPVSWQLPFPIDADQAGDEAMGRLLEAQQPLLAVSLLGFPGLAVPTEVVGGVPVGVQIVAARYQEELCLQAGEAIEGRRPAFKTPIDPV